MALVDPQIVDNETGDRIALDDRPAYSFVLGMTERLAIVGPPNSGKTTLASVLKVMHACHVAVQSTDDVSRTLGLTSEASAVVASWFGTDDGARVIEGVLCARGLRKFCALNPGVKPCCRVLVLSEVFEPPSKGQISFAKAIATVFREIEPELLARGVVVDHVTLAPLGGGR
jgi:hypothetical protein